MLWDTRVKFSISISIISLFFAMMPLAQAQTVDVCEGINCENLPDNICSAGGFKISLTGFTPGSESQDGSAQYEYEVCSPAAGVCTGTVRPGESCLENEFCQNKGQNSDPTATCTRECAVDDFFGLSHFDVLFPELGGLESCLSETNTIMGTCECSDTSSGDCSVGDFVLGDGSCFDGGTSSSFVAKCDSTNLTPGDCLIMTIKIAGELNGLGLGTTVVVDKESNTCTSSCLAGPSCEACDEDDGGEECLTRTIGFWGTHPWITNDYDPVTVCGKPLDCSGPDDGESNPACEAGSCTSIIEGLCSVPGQELPSNQPYVTLVRQLTAAKLNLNATADLFEGANCSDFEFNGKTIQQWISDCENLCGANKSTISNSGCIEALNDFNNSQDVGFQVTPSPFDQPPVDDHGNISGADSSECTEAHGNKGTPKVVIGKNTKDKSCQ